MLISMQTYSDRAAQCQNPLAQRLLHLMDDKQTNLAVAADVTTKAELLVLADVLGPEICILKTHIDMLVDFDNQTIIELQRLAEKHDFLLYEDRKFADIGMVVQLQYRDGMYHIADWAHMISAHSVAGTAMLDRLKEVGLHKGRGVVLIATMDDEGALAHGDYTQESITLAQQHKDFVIGFTTTKQQCDDPSFVNIAPNVRTDAAETGFFTPEELITQRCADVIIVGRAICEADEPHKVAKQFREVGWQAYQTRCQNAVSSKQK